MSWTVYTLEHPATGEVRYVGFTTQTASLRFLQHRHPTGDRHPAAVYTDAQVLEIRDRADAGETIASIARTMGGSYSQTARIARRESRIGVVA